MIRECSNRNAEDSTGIGFCMNNRVPDLMKEAQRRINELLGEKAGPLKKELEDYIGKLNGLLQKYNLNISTIQADMRGVGEQGLQSYSGVDMAISWTDSDTPLEASDVVVLAAAVAALPLVGVTALVDSLFDTDITDYVDKAFTRLTGFFGVDSAKQSALNKIDSIFDELKSKSVASAKENLRTYANACIQKGGQSLDSYVKKYDNIFHRAKEQHQAQRERLNQQLAQNEETFRQIERYARLIQSK